MRKANSYVALALALGLLLAAEVPARAGGAPSVVAECANPALPAEILKTPPSDSAAPLDVVEVTGAAKPLRLAVASDTPTRELGLMCVTALRPEHGMIFVFPRASEEPFWMKNTLISLDMIWVDADGVVTSVATAVPASTRKTPDSAVARRTGFGRFVIELAAGQAAAEGIAVGTRLTVPKVHASQ